MSQAEEDAESIMLAIVLDLPEDGIVRYSRLCRDVDQRHPVYQVLGDERAELWNSLFAKLKAIGFKPINIGSVDWRKGG